MDDPVAVLTVDDSPSFLRVARQLIAATPGFCSVGEAHSGEDALAAVELLRPDLVLLDVRMPAMDGVETTRHLIKRDPHPIILLVSSDDPDALRDRARRCGAAALVRKQDLAPSVLRRLWEDHAGAGAAGSERST